MIVTHPAQPDDAQTIRDVARATWHETYANIYSREDIDAFLDEHYSVQSLTQEIERARNDEFRVFDVAEDETQDVIGFLHMGRSRDGLPWVYRVYVLPSHQRRGIGVALLARLESHLRAFGETHYALHVQEHNALGQAFYLKQGFVHRADLDTGDAWHMEKTLI